MDWYLLSCVKEDEGGGIARYELTKEGKLRKVGFYPCDRPMYAVNAKRGLCVLLRGEETGSYFYLSKDLQTASATRSTRGKVPCHLCEEGDVYVVNYLSGNLVKNGEKIVTHTGKGVNPVRQSEPHTHCAIFSPDKKQVLCCDLGVDTLYCYDRALNLLSSAKIPDGDGIRHAVFSKDGRYIYAISEMNPALHSFSFEGGRVAFKQKFPIPHTHERADGAAIRLSKDGKLLYASLRVENALVVYAVDGEKLTFLQKVDCGGDSPRDFDIAGEHLVVTNEKSGNAVVYALKDGLIDKKTDETSLAGVLCAVVD